MNFDLKKPCKNCPFRKAGAIYLSPGRLEGIVEDLKRHDQHTFQCHKTVHSKRGGVWEQNEDTGETEYIPSGNESACMGAIAYMFRDQDSSVATRLALALGILKTEEIEAVYPEIIDRLESLE